MYRAMVNAGEEAGQSRPYWISWRIHRTRRTPRKSQTALIYPFVLMAVAVAVVLP